MCRKTLLSTLIASSLFSLVTAQAETTKRPNVVFILADDQDARLDSLDFMPSVQKHLIEKGTHFQKHYCTVAVCCPSRVSLWTGKTAHNTNVTNVAPPYGGYPKFLEEGLNNSWVPLWLQEQGYQTYYTGKLMNHQHILNYNKPFVSGFNGSDFLLDPNTYNYMNPIFQRNEEDPVLHRNEYSTDLIHKKGIGFLDDAAQNPDAPFFVTIAPIAPHSDFTVDLNVGGDPPIGVDIMPPVAAERHQNFFSDTQVPRGPSFNPEQPSGVDWISEMPLLTPENITYNDHLYRQRLRSLQAVDEIVEDVFKKLEEYDLLDSTYVFYSSDNGYHIGQHRLPPGKGCGFEEDINVPLIVRGPGVPSGQVVNFPTTHTDLAPTWWDILGIPLREDFDGAPIPLTEESIKTAESGKAKEHIQIEYWSLMNPSEYNNEGEANNTYKGIRIVGEEYGFYYSVWCSGAHELYDMKADPYQMTNLHPVSSNTTLPTYPTTNTTDVTITIGSSTYPLTSLITRLDSLILALKTCKGKPCVEPWNTLLPGTSITTLEGAMDKQYDQYFSGLPRVEWDVCDAGYIAEVEGPMWDDGLAEGFVDVHRFARKGVGRSALNRA